MLLPRPLLLSMTKLILTLSIWKVVMVACVCVIAALMAASIAAALERLVMELSQVGVIVNWARAEMAQTMAMANSTSSFPGYFNPRDGERGSSLEFIGRSKKALCRP